MRNKAKKPAKAQQASAKDRSVSVTGTFEDISLYDLLITLVHSRKSGKVEIQINQERAQMLVLKGEIVRAIYKGLQAEDAIHAIFADIDDYADSIFFVRNVDPTKLEHITSNFTTEMNTLLLNVANSLDEKRESDSSVQAAA